MNIAYFTDTFLPQVNGIATSIATFSRELGRRGHKVIIFMPKFAADGRKQFRAENVHVVMLPSVPAPIPDPDYRISLFGLPKVLKILRSFQPDIIHFHTVITVGMDALLSAKMLKKPLVGTFHSYITTPDYLAWIKSKFALAVVTDFALSYCRSFFDACDLRLAPSKMFIQELYDANYKKPIEYLPNAIDFTALRRLGRSDKQKLKARLHLKEKVILLFGRLSAEKSIDVVIRAFARVAQNQTDVSLLLIGDGPSRLELRDLAKKLHLDKRIIFTGYVDYSKLLSSGILSLGDIFMTASTMENQSMACLEAMSYGLPIVGVEAGGMTELVSANGYLVSQGDVEGLAAKAQEILTDDKLRKKMAQASITYAQKYSVEEVVDRLEKLYKKILV